MIETNIWGVPVKMQGSIVALMAYADEFGTDFNQDFRDAYFHADSPSVSFLLKAAWAMAKGADPNTPSFIQWTAQMKNFSLAKIGVWEGWPRDVDTAIGAEMFRGEAAQQPDGE